MRKKIWAELYQVKYGDNYLVLYLNRHKKIKKWYKILTLLFSTSGILGWNYSWISLLSCGIISIMQLLTLIENQIIPSDKDILNIIKLKEMYLSHFNKLDKFWSEFTTGGISEDDVITRFHKLKIEFEKIVAFDNKLDIKHYKRLITQTEENTEAYFNNYYNHQDEERD